jgi:hypothetical protein
MLVHEIGVLWALRPWKVVVGLWTSALILNWVILRLHRKIMLQLSRVSITIYENWVISIKLTKRSGSTMYMLYPWSSLLEVMYQ